MSTGSKWTDTQRVVEYIHNYPEIAAAKFADMLTQGQVDVLYADMFPPATTEEKLTVLGEARTKLLRAGYAADSPGLSWIDVEEGDLTAP